MADGVRNIFGEPDLAHDLGTPIAAEVNELLIVLVLGGDNVGQAYGFLPRRLSWENLSPEELHGIEVRVIGPGPIDKFGPGFNDPVVATHDLAHARSVAATTYIFQQRRVVEVEDLGAG